MLSRFFFAGQEHRKIKFLAKTQRTQRESGFWMNAINRKAKRERDFELFPHLLENCVFQLYRE